MYRVIFNTSLRKFPSYSALCNRYDMTDSDMNAEKIDHFSLAYAKIVQESVETTY